MDYPSIEEYRAGCRKGLEEELVAGRIDESIVPLVKYLNALPGLYSSGSCSGHGKYPARVWLHVEGGDMRGLFLLAWARDPRFCQDWNLTTNSGEIPPVERSLSFLLESRHSDEDKMRAEAAELIEAIEGIRTHPKIAPDWGF
jgi:hypothetical protein